jgi:hypothetical protein
VILFEVKTLDESHNKDLYIKNKHGEKLPNGTIHSKLERRKNREGKGR